MQEDNADGSTSQSSGQSNTSQHGSNRSNNKTANSNNWIRDRAQHNGAEKATGLRQEDRPMAGDTKSISTYSELSDRATGKDRSKEPLRTCVNKELFGPPTESEEPLTAFGVRDWTEPDSAPPLCPVRIYYSGEGYIKIQGPGVRCYVNAHETKEKIESIKNLHDLAKMGRMNAPGLLVDLAKELIKELVPNLIQVDLEKETIIINFVSPRCNDNTREVFERTLIPFMPDSKPLRRYMPDGKNYGT